MTQYKIGSVMTIVAFLFLASFAVIGQVSLPHTEYLAADTPIYASSSMSELLETTFSLQSGESVQVNGKAVGKSTLSVEVLQAVRVECIASGASWGSAEYINSTRNNLGVNESEQYVDGLPVEARYIYTAPSAGNYTCRLTVRIDRGNWGSIPAEDRKVDFLQDVTYLKVTSIGSGNARWGTDNDTHQSGYSETYLTSEDPSWDVLKSAPWYSDPNVSTINAYADVELTTCKNGTSSCPSEFYGSSTTSHVTIQFIVNQVDADNHTCATFATSPKTYSISNDIHHLKSYNNLTVPVTVTSTCLARFRSRIVATWTYGNPVKIEPGDFIGGPKYTGYSVAWFSNE